MKLAVMLNTSTSYIGEIEINNKVPSMEMVERIAKALEVEPFRLFVDDTAREEENTPVADNYLECLTTIERQDLTKRLITLISHDVEQILQPETWRQPPLCPLALSEANRNLVKGALRRDK